MYDDIAIKYLEKGLVVIPLSGKKPILKDWTNLRCDSPELERSYPMSGIGILTGKPSGIVALDIDKDSAKDKCPLSPVIKRGKKGETRFFKYTGELAIKNHDLGVELLSTGNQTVIPPSIHPETGQSYYWLTPDTLLNIDIEDLPAISNEFIVYLQQNRSFNKFEGRHNALVAHCGKLVTSMMTTAKRVKDLYEYDKNNHANPYFHDESEPHGGRGMDAAQAMYYSVANTAKKNGNFVDPEKVMKIRIEIDGNGHKEIEAELKKLPRMVGLGQELFEDIYEKSYIKRTKFTFMATLQVLSHVIGDKVHYRGTCANLYQYGVAPSGYGKNFPFRRAQEYITEVNADMLAGDSPTSDSIVRRQLEMYHNKLFMVNEAESMLKKMANAKTNFSLRETMTDIYDLPMGMLNKKMILSGRGKDTEEYESVYSPYVGLFLMSTPQGLQSVQNSDFFNTGFLSRFLMYIDDKFKEAEFIDEDDMADMSLDNSILRDLRAIHSIGTTKVIVQLSKAKREHLRLLSTKKAKEVMRDIHYKIEKDKQEMFIDSKFLGLISRKEMFVNKLTILHHVMKHRQNFANYIEEDSIEWAYNAVDAILNNMIIKFGETVFESKEDELYAKFKNWGIGRVKRGKEIFTKAELKGTLKNTTVKQRSELLRDLIDCGEIVIHGDDFKFNFNGRD